jgi:hypothetical protein
LVYWTKEKLLQESLGALIYLWHQLPVESLQIQASLSVVYFLSGSSGDVVLDEKPGVVLMLEVWHKRAHYDHADDSIPDPPQRLFEIFAKVEIWYQHESHEPN